MKNLVLKELKLNVKAPVYLLSLLGTMMLIPNYPLIVGIGYCVFQIFIYMQFVRENLSQEFSAVLPVKRSDIVRSTVCVIALLQMMTLTVAVVCAVIAKFVFPEGNIVGLDPNFTFFGVSLLCLSAFNAVFMPKFFKTGYKYGLPIVLGLLCFVLTYGVCETLVQAIPALRNALDSYNTETVWARLTVLGVGIVTYLLTFLIATKVSVKKFEHVNL